jgi:riboflavin kinase/FMN adenylyltransferase
MEFIHFVRHDFKFPNLDELKAQIAKDKEDVMRLLGIS